MALFAEHSTMVRLLRGVSRERRRFKACLVVAAVLFAGMALTGPRWGFHWEEVTGRGVDIFIAVDVSKSMLAEDVQPNRLERAKRKIVDMLRLFEGDRVGLIAFAGRSFVQCPLTLDYGTVLQLLATLDTEAISVPGTALGDAVDQAVEAFDDKDRKTHALVLLSDGEDLEGKVEAAVARAKEKGIRIYAMGIGKESGAPIRLPEGGFKKDSSGNLILTKLEEKTLKNIALSTGGSYVRSVTGDDDIEQIYHDIRSNVDEKELKSGRQKKFEERYQWLLFVALLFLFADSLTSESPVEKTEKSDSSWKHVLTFLRRRRAVSVMVFLAHLVANSAGASSATSEATQGEAAYRKGDFDEAVKHYQNAEVEDPGNPAIQYDLASAYYKLGKYEEAAKLFDALRSSKDKEISASARYNLGNSAFRENKLEEAIKDYEEALRQKPTDEDSKHNLEVAKRVMQEKQKQERQENQNKKDQKPPEQKPDQAQGSQGKPDDKNKPPESPGKEESSQKETGSQSSKEEKNKPSEKNASADKKAGTDEGTQTKPDAMAQGEDKKEGGQGAKQEPTKDDGKLPQMSKDEAQSWLSRLQEGKPKMEGGTTKGRGQTQVEKDW